MSKPYEIVILGGNFAGVSLTHELIKKTIPSLQSLDKSATFHITLVTPNKDFFFKIAAPRALINDTLIPQTKIIRPLSEAFSKYKPEQFTLTQALATAHDPSTRTVTITPITGGDTQGLHYDSLFIATGTTSASPLWTYQPDPSQTPASFKSLHTLLPTVKSVLIAGGGAVGIETAGEIAHAFPKIEITLLSGGKRFLPRNPPALGERAEAYIKTHAIATVVHNVRVVGVETEGGPSVVIFDDGSASKTVDLYIDATGGKPNSGFLKADWLDETKRVLTRDGYFRVKGNGSDDVEGVYVLGDIVAGSANTAMELDAQRASAVSAFSVDFAKKVIGVSAEPARSSGLLGSLFSIFSGGKKGPALVEFKPMKDTILVPMGPDGGVGLIMGWKFPSFFVAKLKGKAFLTEMIEPMLTGSKIK